MQNDSAASHVGMSAAVRAWPYLVLGLAYTFAYLANPALPGNDLAHPLGWWGWWDQSQYIRSARALATLDFSPNAHWYPMGYSLLASGFARFAPNHPFYFVGLGCLLLTVFLIIRIAGTLGIRRDIAAVLFILALLDRLIFTQFVIPWSTAPVVVYIYGALYLVLRPEPPAWRTTCGAALCAALVLVTRPSDVAVIAPIGLALLIRLLVSHPPLRALRYLLGGAAVLGLVLSLYALLHARIFGWQASPYMTFSAAIGLAFSNFGERLYSVLIDPRPLYGEGEGLVQRAPWLVIAIPALLVGAVASGWRVALIAAVVVVNIGLYTAYADFLPHGIWRYYNIHYLKLSYPLLALLAFNGIRLCWQQPKMLAPALVLGLAMLSIRFEAVQLPALAVKVDDERSLSFTCAGCRRARVAVIQPGLLNYSQIYYENHVARIGADQFRNIYDFRTIPVDGTIRAVFPVAFAERPVSIAFAAPHGYSQAAPPVVTAVSTRFRLRLPRFP